jgi:hypothetical protein
VVFESIKLLKVKPDPAPEKSLKLELVLISSREGAPGSDEWIKTKY